MRTPLKWAAGAAAAVIVLGLAARAQAGGIVFWSSGTRVMTTAQPVITTVQPVVVSNPTPAPVVTQAYSVGYQDGYRDGFHDGARTTTCITTRTITPTVLPIRIYTPTVVRHRYCVPTHSRLRPRVHMPTYTLPSMLRTLRRPHGVRTRGLMGFCWR